MKFERGRKKSQLIWIFSLKVTASQTSVKVLFYLKTEKGKRFGEEYVFKAEVTYSSLCAIT